MYKLKIDREPSLLDLAIDTVLKQMDDLTPDSDEYAKMVTQLEKLHKMKTEGSPKPVSRDVWVTTSANLVGIVLIIAHERIAVITTKALAMLPKLRS